MNIKPEKIEKIQDFTLIIRFTNNELKKLNVKSLDFSIHSTEITDSLFQEKNFKNVKIGHLGQLYWQNIATMLDYDGKVIKCEFDLSPEYVYNYSV